MMRKAAISTIGSAPIGIAPVGSGEFSAIVGGSIAADILPRNRSAFEASVVKSAADTLRAPISKITDPLKTPIRFLPWLAAQESVDLWYADWSFTRKRAMIKESGCTLADLKGTRAGAVRFLSYVDASLLDAIAYPDHFVFARTAIRVSPINHPAFLARYLVSVATQTPPRAMVMSRAFVRRARLKTPPRERFNRVLAALRAAKSVDAQIRVSFEHHRPLSITDAPALDGSYALGDFVPHSKL